MMPMFKYFPNEYVEDVYSIDYGALYRNGFRALLFDIDNTLVAHGEGATAEVEGLFVKLHEMGFKTMLLSNNEEERIRRFIRNIDTQYMADAGKPDKCCFLKAVETLGVSRGQAVMIGDTIHTDIAGANNAGLASILVKYIGYYKKERKGIRRRLEKIVLFFFPLVANKKRII